MSNKKNPCGGFYYDNSVFAIDSHNILRIKPTLERVSDYLYVTEYNNYDYNEGIKFISSIKPTYSEEDFDNKFEFELDIAGHLK